MFGPSIYTTSFPAPLLCHTKYQYHTAKNDDDFTKSTLQDIDVSYGFIILFFHIHESYPGVYRKHMYHKHMTFVCCEAFRSS